ncbi:MAG: hypothetical protein Q4A52_07285 [Bacillota bacterium]|nr:hypothetical protein [Bacillota bacterium]
MTNQVLKDKRIRVIVGHYGSGKSEFSVNYALALAALGAPVTVCDLDIVNPYFRSREVAAVSMSYRERAVTMPTSMFRCFRQVSLHRSRTRR